MTEWYYGKKGQQHGPINEATLRARIAAGEVEPRDLLWSDGMAAWTPLAQLPQFAAGAVLPPQLPVSDQGGHGSTRVDPSSPYAPPLAPVLGTHPQGPSLPQSNGLATVSLVCGILSVGFFCFCGGVFFGIPAVICGHLSLNQLNHPENQQQGRGMAMGGLVCGYVGLAIFALLLLGGNVNVQV